MSLLIALFLAAHPIACDPRSGDIDRPGSRGRNRRTGCGCASERDEDSHRAPSRRNDERSFFPASRRPRIVRGAFRSPISSRDGIASACRRPGLRCRSTAVWHYSISALVSGAAFTSRFSAGRSSSDACSTRRVNRSRDVRVMAMRKMTMGRAAPGHPRKCWFPPDRGAVNIWASSGCSACRPAIWSEAAPRHDFGAVAASTPRTERCCPRSFRQRRTRQPLSQYAWSGANVEQLVITMVGAPAFTVWRRGRRLGSPCGTLSSG